MTTDPAAVEPFNTQDPACRIPSEQLVHGVVRRAVFVDEVAIPDRHAGGSTCDEGEPGSIHGDRGVEDRGVSLGTQACRFDARLVDQDRCGPDECVARGTRIDRPALPTSRAQARSFASTRLAPLAQDSARNPCRCSIEGNSTSQ